MRTAAKTFRGGLFSEKCGIFAELGNSSRPICLSICPFFSMPAAHKLLQAMKHFPVSFVLVGEEKTSCNVAEHHNDDTSDKTTAPFGRPAKPFSGAGCRTARSAKHRGNFAPRSTPSRLL